MEILDVVDEDDNIVGPMSREEIHRLGLMHRACHMLLFNSSGQLFMQKRSMSKDNDPGLWDSSAAGHVDSGESYLHCALRELQEELGLNLSAEDLTLRFKLPPIVETGMEFSDIYTLISDQTLSLDPVEIDDGKWVDPEGVDVWISKNPEELSAAFRLIWSQLRPLI